MVGHTLSSLAGSADGELGSNSNMYERDFLLAALLDNSLHARQGMTGARNAFCTKGIFSIIVSEFPKLKEDMLAALKPPTTSSRALHLASRMSASGAAHRVIRALKDFTFGVASMTVTTRAKNEAVDSVCCEGGVFEMGDIAPVLTTRTLEQQVAAAAAAAAATANEGEGGREGEGHEIPSLDWEAPQDTTDEADDELATCGAASRDEVAAAGTGISHLAGGLAFMLTLIMLQTTLAIFPGDDEQNVLARLSTDAGKIPGAFGVDQHWCPVVMQLLGVGARVTQNGLSCITRR